MRSVGIVYILLFAALSCALPLSFHKFIHARNDPDTFLPTVHLDTAEPVTNPKDSAEFGFTFADEWSEGKRSLDDNHNNRDHEAANKRDKLHPSDGSLSGRTDPISREALQKASPSDSPSKGWDFADAPHRKRQETVAEVVDGIAQPFESAGESTPDPKFPRLRQGWMFASAPHRRDEAYNPCSPSSDDESLIFRDAPINCGRGLLARMKKAVRSILI